jgi:hypothetical protein
MISEKESQAEFAKIIVAACVRRGYLEKLHEGITPVTHAGDYSDVKVIDADGREIPWSQISRINDDEMSVLITGIVDRVHTFLARTLFGAREDEAFMAAISRTAVPWTKGWDDPHFLPHFLMPPSEDPL